MRIPSPFFFLVARILTLDLSLIVLSHQISSRHSSHGKGNLWTILMTHDMDIEEGEIIEFESIPTSSRDFCMDDEFQERSRVEIFGTSIHHSKRYGLNVTPGNMSQIYACLPLFISGDIPYGFRINSNSRSVSSIVPHKQGEKRSVEKIN
jgi:hypothetical protein